MSTPMTPARPLVRPSLLIGVYAFFAYVVAGGLLKSFRWDFFFLAEAFLHGHLDVAYPFPGAVDTVTIDGRVYLPFGPFPAVLFMPLVALVGGARSLISFEPLINSAMAAFDVALCWALLARYDGGSARRRIWLVVLFAFSTPLWWITIRGGVWHTSQIVATGITLIGLLEVSGRRRGWVLGVVAAAGFLTRAPLIFAAPLWIFAAWLGPAPNSGRLDRARVGQVATVVACVVGAVALSMVYNAARFGSPLESGYGLAVLAPELAGTRDHGLFSLAYLPRNLDLFLLRLPGIVPPPLFLQPDGFGLSILITSPGLLLALFADHRRRIAVACAVTAVAVLLPSLLYYGGGWLQMGFRYFLDSIPFVMVLVALGARRRFGGWWRVLVAAGVLVGVSGLVYAYRV
ncbi:MAG: hypothetical protein ABI622_01870 [Chloroflexota bacterium]